MGVLEGYQDQDWCQELGNRFNYCIKSLKKNTSGSTCGCYEFKKEVVHGLGAGYGNKFSIRGSNRMLVVQVAIV